MFLVATMSSNGRISRKGIIISLEGASGVGKSFLLNKLKKAHNIITISEISDDLADFTTVIFSLINRINKTNDIFFLNAPPLSTFYLVLANYVHNFESKLNEELTKGSIVVLDRGPHSTALLQSVLLNFRLHDENQILSTYKRLLSSISAIVPMPDAAFILQHDINSCIERVEQREGKRCNETERNFIILTAKIYERIGMGDANCKYVDSELAFDEIRKFIEFSKDNGIK